MLSIAGYNKTLALITSPSYGNENKIPVIQKSAYTNCINNILCFALNTSDIINFT